MLNLLQETLLYIEQQHEWLSYLQSAITEKEQKYMKLHEKISMKITEQLTEIKLIEFCKDNIVVKQEYYHENEDYCASSNSSSLGAFESLNRDNTCNKQLHNSPPPHMSHESQLASSNADAVMNNSEDIGKPTESEVCSNFDNLNYSYDYGGNAVNTEESCDDNNEMATSAHANICKDISDKSENSSGTVKIESCNKETFDESVNEPSLIWNEHVPKSIEIQENLEQVSDIPSTETDVDRFQCYICHKTFTNKGNLSQHIRIIHGGGRPYQCSFCHKAFNKLGNLNQHLQIHTGEKPFVCLHCNRSFSRKFTLKKHILTHKKQRNEMNKTMN